MKDGFKNELVARKETIDKVKAEMETLYASRLDDENLKLKPDLKTQVDAALRNVEAAVTSYNGTLRSIKLATET